MKGRGAETDLATAGSFCKCSLLTPVPRCPGLGGAEARCPTKAQSLPHGYQGHRYFSCPLLPPKVCVIRTLGSEAEPEPGPRHSTMGPRDPRWYLNHWPSALTLFWFWSPGYIFFATQCLSCQVSELVSLRFYTLLPESFESYEYVDRSRVDFV